MTSGLVDEELGAQRLWLAALGLPAHCCWHRTVVCGLQAGNIRMCEVYLWMYMFWVHMFWLEGEPEAGQSVCE